MPFNFPPVFLTLSYHKHILKLEPRSEENNIFTKEAKKLWRRMDALIKKE